MSDLYFTSNPAEFTQLEGVYINERPPPGFVQAADISLVGFAGQCVRGPTEPLLITSTARFEEVYGARDYGAGGPLVGRVWEALINKPFGAIVVRRVVAADAAAGTADLSDAVPTAIVNVEASSVGAWSLASNGGPTVSVEEASDGDADHWNLRVSYQGQEWLFENLDTFGTNDNLADVISDDAAVPVRVTKAAPGRPVDVADVALAGGADGALAATDYDAALDDLAYFAGVGIVLVPEATPDQSATNGKLVSLAAQVHDRMFLAWSGVFDNNPAAEIAAITADITTRSDRIVWAYNAPKNRDPDTGQKITTAPHVWLASILQSFDVDVHPGSYETRTALAGITELTRSSFTREDLKALRAAGISTLERIDGGFLFRSVVTTSLEPAKREAVVRRMRDYLQLSAGRRLQGYVKAKSTRVRRAAMAAEIIAFSDEHKADERVVEDYEVRQDLNTPSSRARGIEKILWRVRLIGHMLFIVLETDIGTGVTISTGVEAAA